AIRVAPLPAAQQPLPSSGPAEPEPQKPEISLPVDTIRASKAAANPLQAHLKKAEAKRKAEQTGTPASRPKPGGPQRTPPPAAPGAATEGKDRRRGRTGAAAAEDEKVLGGREQRQLNRRRGTPEVR